jgi:hypothetical protein
MASNHTTPTSVTHPAPRREHAGFASLLFGLFGAPIAWSVHEMVSYGMASHACYPGAAPRTTALPQGHWIWAALLAVNLIAIGVAAAAAVTSYRSWAATRRESAGNAPHLLEVGEGRTRFLALWGVLTSAGFVLAIALDIIALLVVPLCGR